MVMRKVTVTKETPRRGSERGGDPGDMSLPWEGRRQLPGFDHDRFGLRNTSSSCSCAAGALPLIWSWWDELVPQPGDQQQAPAAPLHGICLWAPQRDTEQGARGCPAPQGLLPPGRAPHPPASLQAFRRMRNPQKCSQGESSRTHSCQKGAAVGLLPSLGLSPSLEVPS